MIMFFIIILFFKNEGIIRVINLLKDKSSDRLSIFKDLDKLLEICLLYIYYLI